MVRTECVFFWRSEKVGPASDTGYLIDADMIDIIWGLFGTAVGLLYAGMQGMVPCLPPAPLSTSVINTDQYMGSWNFVAATAWDEDGIKSFKDTDSSVLDIQKGANFTLIVTERWRSGEECQSKTWNYWAHSMTDPLLFREDFDAIAMIWDGKWVNCPSCIVTLMIDDDDEVSAMLFSRDEKTPDNVIDEFKSKTECLLMEDFMKAPLTKGYCKQ
ncbi:apolipoprotein M [Triplophysa rosa]|nr:apolipoprotein M [Triplophysa rosa]